MHTGRCYCGASRFVARAEPRATAFCHCTSCRRHSGAPVSAFAAFDANDVDFAPADRPASATTQGVRRHFCPDCGSPLFATYDYLPGQVFVPLGIFDDASRLAPMVHAHAGERLPWLCLSDDAPRMEGTSRDVLKARA